MTAREWMWEGCVCACLHGWRGRKRSACDPGIPPSEDVTWAISSLVVIFLDSASSVLTILSTASCAPRLRSMGFMPAATDLQPSL
jgi:hypothetical protein